MSIRKIVAHKSPENWVSAANSILRSSDKRNSMIQSLRMQLSAYQPYKVWNASFEHKLLINRQKSLGGTFYLENSGLK